MIRKLLPAFLLLFSLAEAIEVVEKAKEEEFPREKRPWFTGPLLAPAAQSVSLGHFNIEPYVYLLVIPGVYDGSGRAVDIPFLWITSSEVVVQAGLASWLDFTFTLLGNFKETQGQHNWSLGDWSAGFDIQLLFESDWYPGIKLSLEEVFPTGKYKNLNPNKFRTDAGGLGSYQTWLGVVFGKVFTFTGIHTLASRLYLSYVIPSSASIQGFSIFGGNANTKGSYQSPQNFFIDLAFEYSLTQNWNLATDITWSYSPKSRFRGVRGEGMEIGHSMQATLAPAIEYSWSNNWGVIAGCWFTVAGRNSTVFQSGVIAFNYYK